MRAGARRIPARPPPGPLLTPRRVPPRPPRSRAGPAPAPAMPPRIARAPTPRPVLSVSLMTDAVKQTVARGWGEGRQRAAGRREMVAETCGSRRARSRVLPLTRPRPEGRWAARCLRAPHVRVRRPSTDFQKISGILLQALDSLADSCFLTYSRVVPRPPRQVAPAPSCTAPSAGPSLATPLSRAPCVLALRRPSAHRLGPTPHPRRVPPRPPRSRADPVQALAMP